MPSPTVQIKDGAGSFGPTTDGVDVTPANTITIALVSGAGVDSWAISCVGTDDLQVAATINASLTIDGVAKTATFTMPAEGTALIFRSSVTDTNAVTTSETFGIYAPVSGLRVGAIGEGNEGNAAFGWTTKLNAMIRDAAGGGLDEEEIIWTPPTIVVDEDIRSVAKYGVAEDATPFAAVTFTQIDETAVDYTSTVLARSPAGDHFRLDLRAAYESTAGVFSTIDAPSSADGLAGNPVGYDAAFDRSGSSVRVWLTLDTGVRWSVVTDAQILKLVVTGPPPTPFDLESLAWSSNWSDAYASSPWTDSVSAGTSGGQTLTEGTNAPTAGSALGGLNCAVLDGVNDKLVTAVLGSDLYATGAGSIVLLYNALAADLPASTGGAPGDALADPGLITDTGYNFVVAINATGPKIYMYDGGNVGIQLTASGDGWHLLQVYWDGVNLHARLDSDAWSTAACGSLYIGTVLNVGVNTAGTVFAKVTIRELRTAPVALAEADFDDCIDGFNDKYTLTL